MLKLKKNNKVFIIAEVGPNHNGSIKQALKIIDKLSKSDVDSIKFQLGNPEKIFSDDSFKAQYQKKILKKLNVKQLSQKNQLSKLDHLKISKHCKKKKIIYSCSAFDLESLKFLDKVVKVPFFKIASGEIYSLDMLEYLSKQKKPIIVSTGMISLNLLPKIIKILTKFNNKKITIMHCVSSYPAEKKSLNINLINTLIEKFKYPVGYSDHSLGEEACLAAVSKNVSVIEKHVTISNKLVGPDHKISMTVNKFKKLVKKIRNLEVILGNFEKSFSKKELNVHKASRKSIVTLKNIKKNQRLKKKDFCFKRPGTGILPLEISKIIGKKSKVNIKQNRILKKKYLI